MPPAPFHLKPSKAQRGLPRLSEGGPPIPFGLGPYLSLGLSDDSRMKKLLMFAGALMAAMIVTLGLNGCAVAALTAAGAYAASSGDGDTAAYHKNNTEREKAGLRPLNEDEWEKRNAVKSKKKSSSSSSSKQEPSSAIPKR
jgi:hypothetical protein